MTEKNTKEPGGKNEKKYNNNIINDTYNNIIQFIWNNPSKHFTCSKSNKE